MAQKRKTDQTKLAAAAALLEKIGQKTERDVKKRLGDNWRDNLFEIVMTKLELAAPHRKTLAAIPSLLLQEPDKTTEFAKAFFRARKKMLILAEAPAQPHHIAAFSALYGSIIDTFLKDDTKDLAKTMAVLDKRLGWFEEFADYTRCKK